MYHTQFCKSHVARLRVCFTEVKQLAKKTDTLVNANFSSEVYHVCMDEGLANIVDKEKEELLAEAARTVRKSGDKEAINCALQELLDNVHGLSEESRLRLTTILLGS